MGCLQRGKAGNCAASGPGTADQTLLRSEEVPTYYISNIKTHAALYFLGTAELAGDSRMSSHREEVQAFAKAVSPSEISFRWTTYNDLWEDWSDDSMLTPHAQNLKTRYAIQL